MSPAAVLQIRSRARSWLASAWFFPVLFLLTILASYALYLGSMGFYYDDWPPLLLARLNNPGLVWSWFAYDRPFSAWTFLAAFPVLGAHALPWQLFTLALRWLTVTAFWWTLRQLWPQRRSETAWMALLMAVYPGFMQQSISIAYSQHFACYALFTLSLGGMAWGIKKPKWLGLSMALALLASLVQLLTMEYFAGLELLRPLLIWVLLRDPQDKFRVTLVKTLRQWSPYLLVFSLFIFYRLVLFNRFSPDPAYNAPVLLRSLAQAPLTTLVGLIQTSLQDFSTANIFAWANTLAVSSIDLSLRSNLYAWLAGLVSAAVVAVYFIKIKVSPGEAAGPQDHFGRQGILIGLLGFFLGGLPVWMIGNQISTGTFADRYTLAPMFGTVILLVSLAAWLTSAKNRLTLLLAVFFGLALAFQVRTASAYRDNWQLQRNYYWQMTWRIPALKPGTTLLAPKMPFALVGEYGVAFADNLLYGSVLDSTGLPYWFFSAYNHLHQSIPDFKPGLPITYKFRIFSFNGSTSQSLLVDKTSPSACFQVVSSTDRLSPSINKDDLELLAISNLEQIINTPTNTSQVSAVLGREPAHTWCYYFEKASLAAQFNDWQTVTQLYAEVSRLGFTPHDGTEWLPFIEAAARTGDWDQALLLTDKANSKTSGMAPYLCAAWQRITSAVQPSQASGQALAAVNSSFACPAP